VDEQKQVQTSPRQCGQLAEERALDYLQTQGLAFLTRNYRMPGRRGNEIDLILREIDGTVVFVEVRSKRSSVGGSAAASVTASKQRKIIRAAHHYLLRWRQLPPCRFDVVSLNDQQIEWIKAAFDAK
jgi:putative endonuclease